jgi:hypothetical protein
VRPGQKTLTELIETVRQRADIQDSDFISDSEITGWLNSSHGELYDELVTAFEGYFEASQAYITDSTGYIVCPSDFLKSALLDLSLSGSTDRVTMHRVSWGDRNRYSSQASTLPGYYCLRGEKIYLFPPPAAGVSLTLWYTPRMTPLANSGYLQVLSQAATGDSVTINGVEFELSDTETKAVDLHTAIASECSDATSELYGLTPVHSPTGTITLTCTRPARVVISDIASTFYVPVEQWQSYLDGYDGWEELPVLDTVIKCRLKSEEDPGAEIALREKMRERLRMASANRDTGGPRSPVITWSGSGSIYSPYLPWRDRRY